MAKIIKFLTDNIWIFAVVFSFPAVWALLVPGFYGASDDMHIAWLYEMDQIIKLGQIPPRFVADLSFGFGYPLFNFLFPLPFYIGEIFHLTGLSFTDSIKAVFFISIPISALFMYFLLREFTNKALSFLGAMIYIYTPYRATDIYIRGAIGEIVSFTILPLLVLAVVKLSSENNRYNFRWIGIGAIAFASLILSHNITAYMFFPFIFFLAVLRIFFLFTKRLKILSQFFITFFLGLLIGSYFWLPAIVDNALMKEDAVFNFSDHFPTLKQLVTPYFGYGASVPGPFDGMSFFIGAANLLLFFLAAMMTIYFWKNYRLEQKIMLIWVLISILIAVFMMNFRSSFIWNFFPMLSYFQFPWRFLIITTLMTPILVIALDKFKSWNYFFIFLSLLVVVLNAGIFKPQDYLGRDDKYFLNRYIPVPKASQEYLSLQEEYLRLPKDLIYRPDKNYPLVSISSGNIQIRNSDGLNISFSAESNSGAVINYYKYNFPGWKVLIDRRQAEIIPGSPFSQISFNLPYGFHEVKISFEETSQRKILNAVSLVALLLAIYLLFTHENFKKFCYYCKRCLRYFGLF